MTKYKVGDKVIIKSIGEECMIRSIRDDTNSDYIYAIKTTDGGYWAWYSDNDLDPVESGKVYVVASYDGHDNWHLSDDIHSAEELLDYIATGIGSKYRIFVEHKLVTSVEER